MLEQAGIRLQQWIGRAAIHIREQNRIEEIKK